MSAAPGPYSRSPSMRGGPSCSVRTTSRCPASATCGPAGAARQRHDERVAVAADRRAPARSVREPLAATASQSACSSPIGDGIAAEPEQRLGERASGALTPRTPKSRSAALRRRLLVGALLALADDERARHADSPAGNCFGAHAGDHHAARRHAAAVLDRLGAGDVDDRRRRGEHHAGADAPPRARRSTPSTTIAREPMKQPSSMITGARRAARARRRCRRRPKVQSVPICAQSRPSPRCRPSCPRRRTRRCSRSRASRSRPARGTRRSAPCPAAPRARRPRRGRCFSGILSWNSNGPDLDASPSARRAK